MNAKELMEKYEESIHDLKVFEALYESVMTQHKELLNNVSALEADLKKAVKEERQEVAGQNYVAKLQIRRAAPTIDWQIELIEKQPWASAVLQKSVDQKSFEALAKIGKIEDPESFKMETPGKEILAVSIEEIQEGG